MECTRRLSSSYNLEYKEDFHYLLNMLDLVQELHEEFLQKRFTSLVPVPSPPPFCSTTSVPLSPAATVSPSPPTVPASAPAATPCPTPVATVPLAVGFQVARLAPGRQAARLVAWPAPESAPSKPPESAPSEPSEPAAADAPPGPAAVGALPCPPEPAAAGAPQAPPPASPPSAAKATPPASPSPAAPPPTSPPTTV
ncbi:vegetative cell wall protein gp1-like [Poecilia reticulata]|uniref:vegetative cell wall protein gp1-like n=1 Tax=Poecilia reticulata TaxID=8081 RepID=UPI0007E984E3|nr:PREDICTED: vegetative cell wall protein gp1-like [Poecilia reticulata]